ncbi:hypothetical protein DYBT9275_00019 [Dyadobacter sp. CECT 9275]|uniref:Ig-like domain-containing protein n=1 Tax=Dyadobacter helix TaxID=2822344 RepID=A0A916J8L1_9BACT|nr:T9SS type A sorting domain-containing protein [Dyadobacter sp. CECT 9275]CAG4988166.1 hypothetical protein DYBT9275_00019 [Dyadobacter sp. CECT 9275]
MKNTFISKRIFTCLAAILGAAASFAQTITTSAVSPASYCAGSSVSVAFTTTGTFDGGNVFTAQLSDATGSFTTPLATSTGTSPISVNIPSGAATGATYKVRVIASLPVTTGTESAAFTINAKPAAPAVVNKTYTVGDTPVSLTLSVTGTDLMWYTAENGGSGSGTPPTISTATASTTSYWVTQTVGTCESARAEIVVTVNCTPPAAPTVSPVSYTVGDSPAVLTATGAMGSTLKWYDAATDGNLLSGAPTPTTTAAGTQKYYVSQTVAGCESTRAEIVVTINACTPPAPPTVAPVSYTVGDTPAALTATGVMGSTLKWYDAATGGNLLSGAPTPTTTAAGTQKYYVSQTVAGCESTRAEIVVTINACTPPAPPTVAPVSYTVGDTPAALTATGVMGSTLKWYDAATAGNLLSGAPTPTTTAAGTQKYYVSQTVASCESTRAEIVVTINACTPPPAPGVSDISYCLGASTIALTATGTNLKWYANASGGSALGAAPTPSSATAGDKSYYVTQTVGVCESARAEIKVTVNKTDAPVVINLEYCLNATATALTASGTALKWYAEASGGTALGAAPTPATNIGGTKSYYVTQTLNGCESTRAEIKVVIKNLSEAPIVTALNLCQNSTATALTATGTSLKWYTVASGGSALGSAPVPSTTVVETTSYYVSQTTSGLCEGPRAKMDVVIKDTPVAPTVETPINYCVGQTPTSLSPSGDVYKWYTVGSGGTALSAAPTPTATIPGTTSYYVTQSNTYGVLSCESSRAKVDIIVNATPSAVNSLSEAFCQERADKSYTFPTKAESGNTLNWYTDPTGGTASTSIPSINLKNFGETTYYATQVTNKGCESTTRIPQKVRVKPLPSLPTITQALIEYCQFAAAAPLTATPVTNASLNWFGTNETGGTSSGTAPTPSTATGGTTAYFVAQTLEGCTGDRAKIEVKINTTPKPTTTPALAYCQGEVAPILDATGTILKWYRTADGTEWQGVPFTPFTEKVQDYSFYVTQTGTNGCESPKQEIKIHIKALPSATISGDATIDLGQTANLKIDFTSDGPWTYVLSSGKTATSETASTIISVAPPVTTTYVVTEVSNACGKGFPIGRAVVTVKIPTITTGNPSVAEACAGKTFSLLFAQSGEFPKDNKFVAQISTTNDDTKFYSIPSVVTGNTITATFPDTTKGGSYLVRVVSEGTNPAFTVKGSVSQIGIKANPIPTAVITGSKTILIGESANLNVEIFGEAPWTFTLNNGVSDSLISAATSPYNFKITPSKTTIYTVSSVTNTCGTGKGTGSARIQVDPILGIEPPVTAWMKVYPTMVGEKCVVEITEPVSVKGASLEIIDLNGRVLKHQQTRDKISDMDFRTYPSGLYLIRVQNGNLSGVQRVVKP